MFVEAESLMFSIIAARERGFYLESAVGHLTTRQRPSRRDRSLAAALPTTSSVQYYSSILSISEFWLKAQCIEHMERGRHRCPVYNY